MSASLSRCVCRALSQHTATTSLLSGKHQHAVTVGPWFAHVMTLKTSAPLRAEPKKKKKVDPKREQMMRDRLKKKLRKLEKVPPQYIPIEDYITPASCMDDTRQRPTPKLSFEESERRALLLKEWCLYKQEQQKAEMKAIQVALEAQSEALKELKLESEELYQAALKPDSHLFPLNQEGLAFTPAKSTHEAPDGKYSDVTKVYTQ